MSFGGHKLGLLVFLLMVIALGALAVAQTLPVKLILQASEPIRPVSGDSILGRFWASGGARGMVNFYPVAGSDERTWSALLPSLPAAATVELVVLPGAFQDHTGNLNNEMVRCRLPAQSSHSQNPPASASFWQLH